MTGVPKSLWRTHVLLAALIALGATGCDQVTKHWARHALADRSVELAGGHVHLVVAENRGAFLSLGEGLPEEIRTIIFTLGAAVLLGAVAAFVFVKRSGALIEMAMLSLVIGGGLGNLIDRVVRSGAVTDFIVIRLGPLRTGIFNLADVCLTAGALAMLALSARRTRNR